MRFSQFCIAVSDACSIVFRGYNFERAAQASSVFTKPSGELTAEQVYLPMHVHVEKGMRVYLHVCLCVRTYFDLYV